jgi:D-alanine--poly(phosphoribitol) ligase subunit 2
VTDTNAIIGRLGALFSESLHIEAPSADTDLFETGILDSLQLVELLLQIEQRFGFQIKIDDIDLDDLRTLARIARLIAARTAGSQPTRLSSLEVRHGMADQEANQTELQPKGTEPRAGRVEANRASTIGSPLDSVSAKPVLRSGSAR